MNSEILGKNIVEQVDELVNIIVNLNVDNEDYKLYKDSAIEKTGELIPLLTNFIEGNMEYIEPMLNQLIRERLSDDYEVENLDLKLSQIVKGALSVISGDADETEAETESSDLTQEEESLDNTSVEESTAQETIEESKNELQNSINRVYPKGPVAYNLMVRGQLIDAYLEDRKIALTSKKISKSLEYFCERQGIRVFYVPKEIRQDYRRLARALKQIN